VHRLSLLLGTYSLPPSAQAVGPSRTRLRPSSEINSSYPNHSHPTPFLPRSPSGSKVECTQVEGVISCFHRCSSNRSSPCPSHLPRPSSPLLSVKSGTHRHFHITVCVSPSPPLSSHEHTQSCSHSLPTAPSPPPFTTTCTL
jgi:hypothetical protein